VLGLFASIVILMAGIYPWLVWWDGGAGIFFLAPMLGYGLIFAGSGIWHAIRTKPWGLPAAKFAGWLGLAGASLVLMWVGISAFAAESACGTASGGRCVYVRTGAPVDPAAEDASLFFAGLLFFVPGLIGAIVCVVLAWKYVAARLRARRLG
jgi:hypothetical protein